MEFSNILVWNVRKLNNKLYRDATHTLVGDARPDIVCLQETKISNMNTCVLLSTIGSELDQHVLLPAQGSRGGILLAWHEMVCRAITSRVDNYSVTALLQSMTGRQWWVTGFYDPQLDAEKREFIQELPTIRSTCTGPWVLLGDFNMIYRAADKNN